MGVAASLRLPKSFLFQQHHLIAAFAQVDLHHCLQTETEGEERRLPQWRLKSAGQTSVTEASALAHPSDKRCEWKRRCQNPGSGR